MSTETEYVVMPKSDYVSVCDTIREKTGSTEPIKSNELVEKINQLGISKEEQEKVITITENGTTEILPDEGKVLSKVSVNVDVKGNEEFIGIKYSEFVDMGNGYKLATVGDARSLEGYLPPMHRGAYLFANVSAYDNGGRNGRLKTVYLPSGIDRMMNTFDNCVSLENIIGDLSEVTETYYTFFNCISLKEVPYMPNLKSLGAQTFSGCTSLTSVTLYQDLTLIQSNSFMNCTGLTEFNIPEGFTSKLYLQYSTQLTQESLHKIIENYADMTGQTSPICQIGSVNIEKIDDEHKAMATAKNITLA